MASERNAYSETGLDGKKISTENGIVYYLGRYPVESDREHVVSCIDDFVFEVQIPCVFRGIYDFERVRSREGILWEISKDFRQ